MISITLLLQTATLAPAPLPSATYCAAAFGMTYDMLKQKSGDPAMTKGFADDFAALRQIVLAGEAKGSDAAADAAIAAERARLEAEAAKRPSEETVDLKPCYRVKALGRGSE